MEAIILAGGKGSRLRSVVNDVPKPMASVANRPFLEWLMDYLISFEIDHIVLSVGYMYNVIQQHFGSQYKGIPLSYSIEETPLGTGGGIKKAFQWCETNDVLVLNGDTFFKVDYDALYLFYQRHETRLAMILRQVADVSRYGAVVTDCSDRVVQFIEKSASSGIGAINGGVYMLNRSLFDQYTDGINFSFEQEILQKQFLNEQFYAFISGDYFIDIGIPEDYLRFNQEISQAIN